MFAARYDGANLMGFVNVREQINNFVYDAINWQQKEFLDSKTDLDSVGNRLIGVLKRLEINLGIFPIQLQQSTPCYLMVATETKISL